MVVEPVVYRRFEDRGERGKGQPVAENPGPVGERGQIERATVAHEEVVGQYYVCRVFS
jgi:hypothetical protein